MDQEEAYRDIHIREVCDGDAEFLYRLMNDPAVLERLNEVPTAREDWTGAIGEWARDEDEEDYIVPTDRIPDGRKNGWPYLGDFVEGGDGSLLVTAYSPNLVLPLEAGDGAIFTFEVVADEDFHGGVIECKFSELTNLEFEKTFFYDFIKHLK